MLYTRQTLEVTPEPSCSRWDEPFPFGRAWHADGTPFSVEDYRKAGLHVPTDDQFALLAEQDRLRQIRMRRREYRKRIERAEERDEKAVKRLARREAVMERAKCTSRDHPCHITT